MVTLNVIYTPAMARPLAPFAATLLRWSDCRVRLVANGCSKAECTHLAALATQEPRFAFIALPTTTLWPHGAALDWLHDRCDERYFAFVDSDLFAVAPFMPAGLTADLTCLLAPAVYWDAAEERRQALRHRMGCTYFAIYDNARLHAVRRQWGVGFAKQRWERLSADQQAALAALDYRKQRYDTGKLLNALLVAEGGRVAFGDAAPLCHLGGLSHATTTSDRRGWWQTLKRRLRARAAGRDMRARDLKAQSADYFAALLPALATGQPQPPLPRIADPYVAAKFAATSRAIGALFAPPSADGT